MLPYEAVRGASDPEAVLLEFFQSTYDAAADSAAGIAPRWIGRKTNGHDAAHSSQHDQSASFDCLFDG